MGDIAGDTATDQAGDNAEAAQLWFEAAMKLKEFEEQVVAEVNELAPVGAAPVRGGAVGFQLQDPAALLRIALSFHP